jgi:hypothetical protein
LITPISPDPVLDDAGGLDQLPAYLSNGVIGLRIREVPLLAGIATVSGLEGEHPDARVACVPAAPYSLAGDIHFDSISLSHHWTRIHDAEQRYDFTNGELHSTFSKVRKGARFVVRQVSALPKG